MLVGVYPTQYVSSMRNKGWNTGNSKSTEYKQKCSRKSGNKEHGHEFVEVSNEAHLYTSRMTLKHNRIHLNKTTLVTSDECNRALRCHTTYNTHLLEILTQICNKMYYRVSTAEAHSPLSSNTRHNFRINAALST